MKQHAPHNYQSDPVSSVYLRALATNRRHCDISGVGAGGGGDGGGENDDIASVLKQR